MLSENKCRWLIGLLLEGLDLSEEDLAGGEDDVRAQVTQALEAQRRKRAAEDRALGVGEIAELGGERVEIRPLPAREAAAFRKFYFEIQDQAGRAKAELAAAYPAADELEIIMRSQDHVLALRLELLGRWGVGVPEGATDQEIERALAVVQKLAFPILGELSEAVRVQMKLMAGSSQSSPATASTRPEPAGNGLKSKS